MFDFDDLDDSPGGEGDPACNADETSPTPAAQEVPAPKAAETEARVEKAKEDADRPTLYTKREMEDMIEKKFKAFSRLPCAECGKAACKRFSDSMPLVVKTMVDAFWCKECGRLLCEQHRDAHTCERAEAAKEARAAMAPERIREQLEEERRRKALAEEEAKAPLREATKAADERRQRRGLLAEKSWYVTNFFQTAARDDAATRSAETQRELLDLYEKSNRLSTFLYNEHEKPTLSGLADEEWSQLKKIYQRGVEILGVVAAVPKDGNPESGEVEELDMTNPWERPSTAVVRPQPQRPVPVVQDPPAPAPTPASSSTATTLPTPAAPSTSSQPVAGPGPALQRPLPVPSGFQARLNGTGRPTTSPLISFPGRPGAGRPGSSGTSGSSSTVPTLVSRPNAAPSTSSASARLGTGRGAGLPGSLAPGGPAVGAKGFGKGPIHRTLGVLGNRGGSAGRGRGRGV